MIAALTQSLSLDNLPVNWFDGALLLTIGFGVFRGRKNGLTREIIPTIEWVILITAAGLAYGFLAPFYTDTGGMSRLLGAIFGYLSIALVTFLLFSGIKKAIVPRLAGSNVFGSAEYYLGMASGMIRYACIVIFFLALLNARHYTSAEIAATKAYNMRWYGGGIYSGDYVPDIHNVQQSVFKDSFTGPYIHDYLGMLLIQTTPEDAPGRPQAAKPKPIIHIGH